MTDIVFIYSFVANNERKKEMKTLHQLQQELKDLQVALKNKTISVNEYCYFYYSISQQIKKLRNK